ncbi:MAG TPA: WecB/TagA/CpsF family glycosyltransferase [Steroidobacteraceae bacterium]|nr:WecB/TagA/CpsF family glycosyltransferase [Steroidobacteraceae bacterium]
MLEFAGLPFRGLTLDDVFRQEQGLAQVVTVNAEYIVLAHRDERLARILSRAISTFDGQVPYALARLQNPNVRFEKIPGSELVYHICARAHARHERVFLLGGQADSNRESVRKLQTLYPGLHVAGYSPPHARYPFPAANEAAIAAHLEAFAPDYLCVGFGAGKQDYWIDDHRKELDAMGVKLAVGVGGSFEMISGKLPRAPRIVQRMGLEGVYRLLQEPRAFRVRRLLTSLKLFYFV